MPPRPTSDDDPAPKSARRFAVALSRTVDVVAMLARATSPRFAPLLATARLSAITVMQNGRKAL